MEPEPFSTDRDLRDSLEDAIQARKDRLHSLDNERVMIEEQLSVLLTARQIVQLDV